MAVPLVAMVAQAAAKRAAQAAAKAAVRKVASTGTQRVQENPAQAGLLVVVLVITLVCVVLVALGAAITMLGALGGALGGAAGGPKEPECGGAGVGASALALADIPPDYLALYQSGAQRVPGLDWTYVAAIGKIETNHGRSPLPGVLSGTNSSGAAGPMQFLLATWASVGVDGDGDGDKDIYDPKDAIPGAANYLQIEGAPGNMHDAIFAYNHAEWYVADVEAQALLYRATTTEPPTGSASASPAFVGPVVPSPSPLPILAPIAGTSPEPVPLDPIAGLCLGGNLDQTYTGGVAGNGSWGGHTNGKIPTSELCAIRVNQFLRCDAAKQFLIMDASYKKSFGGAQICVTDAYRTYESQVILKALKGRMAATPGTSNHGWGLATDLGCGINRFGTAQHVWMQNNAPRFGWLHPSWARQGGSKEEAWHWEFGSL